MSHSRHSERPHGDDAPGSVKPVLAANAAVHAPPAVVPKPAPREALAQHAVPPKRELTPPATELAMLTDRLMTSPPPAQDYGTANAGRAAGEARAYHNTIEDEGAYGAAARKENRYASNAANAYRTGGFVPNAYRPGAYWVHYYRRPAPPRLIRGFDGHWYLYY